VSLSDTHTNVPRLAYLTSHYPFTSHTFISREIASLRLDGAEIDTFSIRPASPADLHDERMQEEWRRTYAVLRQPLSQFAAAHLAAMFRNPARYFRALGLALGHRPPGLKGLGLSLAHFGEAILLARELQRRRVGHLHNHFANSAATVGYLATRFLGLPWSFTMHGISETDYPAGLLLGRKIEAADFVACVSYFGRAQAMRLVSHFHWAKLHVVRCGLPLETLGSSAKAGRSSQIVCVGRLSPEKGQFGLFEAFARVASELPELQLLLVGDGPDSNGLRSRVDQLGFAGRVKFAGALSEDDAIKAIACSQMLVLPSFMEGLPVVLIEAMAVGTPVIASRVAGIPELVEHGETGLLFTASNWDELASCIRTLAGSEELRERLADGGRKRIASEFDSHRSAERLLELFQTDEAQ
jgi:glycosyltransferase involved in cell wall biosynthesis